SLYAAYSSKDALFAAVVTDWVDQGHDALREPLSRLAAAEDVFESLSEFCRVLQSGILSPPVLAIRALVIAEADQFPDLAADYLDRSWNRHLDALAETLADLSGRDLLAVEEPHVAAAQLVWLVIGHPLNTRAFTSAGSVATGGESLAPDRLVEEGVVTFLARYGA
ncbi:MAG: hypothetical protein QOK15_622, partial [Nocardioidaceae bacterium]|nr:hypothetical protein [Nocardioidaceae bacterium]